MPDAVVEPTVSVVIPCRNAASTVAAAVRSARAQTLAPREVLVVDDGSADDSVAAAEAAGARVLRASRRGYAGGARNQGIEATSGDLVAFMDADVEVGPDWLALAAATLAAQPRVAAVGGRIHDGRGGLWGRLDHLLIFSEWMSGRARACSAFPTIAVVYRRAAIGATRFPESNLAEDVFFCQAIQDKGWGAWYEPRISIVHRHERLTAGAFWRRQVQAGRALYRSRSQLDRPGRFLAQAPWLMLALPHLWIVLARMAKAGAFGWMLALLPWLVAGEVARGVGFLRGRREFGAPSRLAVRDDAVRDNAGATP
jgi:glycosyltransferase involved in cell wall biosynthesis